MKFYCDNCQAKYQIADEKVRGKILKIRCKNCNHTIVVREPHLPQAQATAPPLPTPSAPQVQWHYALNGQTFGPYDESSLKTMFTSGELTDACYLWQASFGTTWKPAVHVPLFLAAIEAGRNKRPKFNTIGISGESQAISSEQVRPRSEEEEAGVVPGQDAPTPSETSLNKGALSERLRSKTGLSGSELKSRLSSLQERIQSHQSEAPAPAEQSDRVPSLFDAPAKPLDLAPVASQSNTFPTEDPTTQMSVSEVSALMDHQEDSPSDWDTKESEPLTFEQPEAKAPENDPFSLPPSVATNPVVPQELSESANFAGLQPPPESVLDFSKMNSTPSPEDSLLNAEAPLILGENEKSGSFQPTQSLLIQMDSIKKEGRKQRTVARVAIALLLVAVLGVGGWAVWNNAQQKKEVPAEPTIVFGEQKGSLVIKTYSEEDRNQFLVLGNEEVITAEESKAIFEEIERESKQGAAAKSPTKTPNKSLDIKPNVKKSPTKVAKVVKSTEKPEPQMPTKRIKKPSLVDGLRSPSKGIHSPGTKASKDEKRSGFLPGTNMTQADAKKGFKKISRSVKYCHQKHTMRGLPLESPKVVLTVEVQNSGRVSGLKLKPAKVNHTVFDSCMRSQMARWKFSIYEGKSIKIKHTYVLQ